MSQLTVYLDEDTRERVERAARAEGVSVSPWVRRTLARALDATWPAGYFDRFGCLREEEGCEEPGELPPGAEGRREAGL